MKNEKIDEMAFSTKAIHGGHPKDQFRALTTPIYQTATYTFESAEQGARIFAHEEPGYIYGRSGNPNNTEVEEKIALLEGAEAGLAVASGMGAIASVLWTVLNAGDHVVAAKTLYGCTFSLLNHNITRFGVDVTFVDTTNLEDVKSAIRPNTKVVYLETPANPTMLITDIKAISEIAHKVTGCLVIVDNTFCTPYIQKPLELGADVVVHSATKYLNGHGDVIAGMILGNADLIKQVRSVGLKDMTGAVLSPNNAFLIARGMKTLEIRMDKHCSNALKVAEFLESHPAVEKVNYPGLESFNQYELAKKQMRLPGAMMSFDLKGGLKAGKFLMNNLHLCILAVSLGDAETLIEHPASMTHATYSPEERAKSGISEGLVRLSVGLEAAEDIIDDLKQALDKLL